MHSLIEISINEDSIKKIMVCGHDETKHHIRTPKVTKKLE